MREIKTLKRLTPLTLSLAIALVGVLSLSSGVGAASVTETNIVTSSWQAYYTSNPECDTIYGSGNVGSAVGQTVDLSGAGTITFGTKLSSGAKTWTITSYQQKFE
jgi:hypothetical protein